MEGTTSNKTNVSGREGRSIAEMHCSPLGSASELLNRIASSVTSPDRPLFHVLVEAAWPINLQKRLVDGSNS